MEFAGAFMGQGGFDQLKKHCKQGDDFCKEVLSILNERSACEMSYAKSLKRLSQRLSKACSGLMGSPLSTLWKTIQTTMDGEADVHKKFATSLLEDCVKPSAPVIDNLSKSRRNMELSVDSASKIMSERIVEHGKLKKLHHKMFKERESVCEQLEGARPKTKNDESKLAQKQSKTEVLLARTNDDYYEALLELQRKQTEWELKTRNSCVKIQGFEQNKLERLCSMGMAYGSLIRVVSQQLNGACEQVKKQSSSLDSSGEIRIIVQNRKVAKYQSELILCDYYCENFKNHISKSERRLAGLTKPLEKFLGDLQKERAHHQGMANLINAQSSRATEDEKLEMQQKLFSISSMITFLELNRSKLQKAISTINGKPLNLHPLTEKIQQHYDKQGIINSTVTIPVFDDAMNDEVFASSPSYESVDAGRNFMQRSQSEKVRTVDDIDIGRSGARSHSFDRHGTMTASRIQSYGMGNGRRLAPGPPIPQNFRYEAPAVERCVAKYAYEARESDELTLQEGDVIIVLEKIDADWWKGQLNGHEGIFPATYVDEAP